MLRLWLTLYSAFYSLGLLLYLPVLLKKILVRRENVPVWERLGNFRKPLPDSFDGAAEDPVVWIHAVSVGEVQAIGPLVEALSQRSLRVFVSTTTATGQKLAQSQLRTAVRIFYFPLDWKWVCRKYLSKIRPAAVLLAETELWPNFIATAAESGIPVLLVNGRISDRSFGRYQRIRPFLRPFLARLEHLCMQSKLDKDRIIELGAPSERVNWVGNLKYDYEIQPEPEIEKLKGGLRQALKEDADSLIWVCGSTRAGEEELLLPVFASLKKQFPGLKLILAPRHPERGDEVASLVKQRHFHLLQRSRFQPSSFLVDPPKGPLDVIVLDSIGELRHIYELADLVFIGGSLVTWGGQNPIEPAVFARPILFGPHMQNFRAIARDFVSQYAALQVDSPQQLEERLADLLRDEVTRSWLGRNARKVIRTNQGALRRTLEIVDAVLGRHQKAVSGSEGGS